MDSRFLFSQESRGFKARKHRKYRNMKHIFLFLSKVKEAFQKAIYCLMMKIAISSVLFC